MASDPTTPTPVPPPVEVALLGGVATRRDGELVPLPGPRARALLVALARRPGRSRSVAALVDDVWGEQPPRSPVNALHTQISRLRAVLPDGAIAAGPSGYRLTLAPGQVDLALVRSLTRRAGQSHADGDLIDALDTVRDARALWRGEPGADLPDGGLADDLAAEAASYRRALDTVQLAALIAAGRFADALPLARAAAAAAPLDEAAAVQWMECLRGVGRGGEALDVFAALRVRLADRLGADPSPRLVELNAAILHGDTTGQAPSTSVPPTTIGLRAAPNPLLGRKADLAALEVLLGASRVVTVLGPGGTGKTRVAHALGLDVASRMPVALVELAPLRSGEDLIAAISGTLGIGDADLGPGSLARTRIHDARRRLRDALSARPSLLILDNCEHLIDDVADVVSDLIAASPQLTVLTTSRAPLTITAEAVYPLPPLAIGEDGSPAVELFRARAAAVRPSVRLDRTEVERLCRTLDGLPLAIELAAARVRTMSVEEINARLADRFALLRSRDRTTPERHRTLRAVIDWSWNLLEDPERAALRRLCRFPAGFTSDAAVSVAQWGDLDDVDDALEGLVNQSMLSVTERGDTVGLRYHMLETVREFGEERADADESAEVYRRTAVWAERFARDALRDFMSGRQIEVAHRVEDEHDNLLAVLRYAMAERLTRTVYTIFPVLGSMWASRGAHSEVFAWAPRVLDLDATALGPDEVPGDHLAATYQLAGVHLVMAGRLRAVAVARTRLRRLLATRDDVTESLRMNAALVLAPGSGKGVARLLATAVRSDDPGARSSALVARANLRENNGDLFGSESDARQALVLAERSNDSWGLAMMCQHLGSLCAQSARYDEAVRHYRRSAEMLWEMHLYDEGLQVRGFMVAALVGAGRSADAFAELAALAPMRSDVPVGEVGGEHGNTLASLSASAAEAELAVGSTDRGLDEYRRAITHMGDLAGPSPADPLEIMVAVAVVDAHVLAGRTEPVDDLVARLAGVAVERLGPRGHPDLPQTGAVACAVGSFGVATGRDVGRGLRLLALAGKVHARQDYPSMRLDRHVAVACAVAGTDRVAAARASVERIPRAAARDEILTLLATATESD
ncbi:BTAD domain-containing putative transcriptional regulator [Prescottella subtropica]|uniref:BTAD domain-containing putative transcriptional regulator n=1 Tax=Prescottella subtropica TaxID=2545757 RepID=UPI001F4F3065|nr:BTAD domain-containing putative transcriptional regulator [Prescottella subtropica]